MKRTPSLSKLITIAKTARRNIEKLSAIEGGPANLEGYCGVAARYIELEANKDLIEPQFICGYFNNYYRALDQYTFQSGHSWIEYDGYIIDITATQFKFTKTKVNRDFGKKIYISRSNNPHYSKLFAGAEAHHVVSGWYEESLEEICDKANL